MSSDPELTFNSPYIRLYFCKLARKHLSFISTRTAMHMHIRLACVFVAFRLQSTWGDAATDTKCSGKGELSKPFQITCAISGSIESGIAWTRPDAIKVAICNPLGHCPDLITGYTVIVDSPVLYKLNISKLDKKDIGEWQCRDESGTVTKNCNINSAPEGTTPGGGGTTGPGDINRAICLNGDHFTSVLIISLALLISN